MREQRVSGVRRQVVHPFKDPGYCVDGEWLGERVVVEIDVLGEVVLAPLVSVHH